MKSKGLGRGLDALLDRDKEEREERAQRAAPAGELLAKVAIDTLQRGKYQPRTRMDAAALEELAASIRTQGLMQPILVRPIEGTGARYEIIAGERRWRAARIAGLAEVPVVVRDVPDQAALSMALIENIQREELNALEEAQGLQRLAAEFGMTHQEIADAIGRSRAAVSNALRLLNLSAGVQKLLSEARLDMGHARALLALEGRAQDDAAAKVVERGLSVRETEQWVQELMNPALAYTAKRDAPRDRDVQRFAEELSERFGTAVELKAGRKGSGKLVITYADNSHLESLLARFR
jgi:ParB family chromosome partitioning protein